MDTGYMEKILKNTIEASRQWSEFEKECKDIDLFKKYFHLRPTGSGVTIVSTLESRPMRGKKVGRTVVKKWLEELYNLMMSNRSQGEKEDMLTQLGFQIRKKSSTQKYEETHQAKMIAEMTINQSLKDYLGVDDIIFIASEFILHDDNDTSDRERIDIIGYDGKNRIFFFELKAPENETDDPVEQVKRYIKKYGGIKRKDMLSVLKDYPINSIVKDDVVIEGYAVYGYGDEVNIVSSKKADNEDKVGIIKFI